MNMTKRQYIRSKHGSQKKDILFQLEHLMYVIFESFFFF